MPMKIYLYPENWRTYANAYKDKIDWKCEECSIGHMEDGTMGSCLTVHHPDRDPENPEARLEGLCARCHLAAERRLRREERNKDQIKLFHQRRKTMNKKIFAITTLAILLILAVSAPALAKKTYEFTLSQVNAAGVTHYGISGITTATTQDIGDSGVSPMVRRHGTVPDELKREIYTIDIRDSNGLFSARIKDLDPAAAYTGALGTTPYGTANLFPDDSGTTCAYYVKIAPENTAVAWAKADYIPIFRDVAINSSVSPFDIFFRLPQANYLRSFFLPSGTTPFGNGQVEITTDYDIDEVDQFPPILIKSLIYSLNGNSGVSTTANDDNSAALPMATRYGEMFISGSSVFYTVHKEAPVNQTAKTLQGRDYRELNQHELNNLQMQAISDTYVRIDCYTARP